MSTEILSAIDALGRNFEEFKKNNDARIKEIEKKGHADPLLEEKVDKLSTKLNELEQDKARLEEQVLKANRFSSSDSNNLVIEHKKAFDKFMRKGRVDGLEDLEKKAFSYGSGANGGYLVPTELDLQILDLLKPVSPIRNLANIITVSSGNYEKLVNERGTSSGWVGETAARAETNTPTLSKLTPYMGEIYANPAVTQTILDDAAVNVEAMLSNEVIQEFAYQEGVSFVTGDGVAQPKGVAGYTFASTNDGTRAFGQVQYVATGVSGDWAASNKADVLLDLIAKFKNGMLQGAVWAARGTTITAIRKLKDGQGQYLWAPGLVEGQRSTLFGYPVEQVDALAAIGANSYSIALANWKRAYTIVDRLGTRVIRDEYTNKPYVHFYTTKRVGGFLVDSEAIKFVKFGAS